MSRPLRIVVLGSTGSIGVQTLEVASQFPERVEVVGLATHRNVQLLRHQLEKFRRAKGAVADPETRDVSTVMGHGPASLIDMVVMADVDLVVVATVGAAGLLPTLAALGAGKRVALANKETLVMAGPIIMSQSQGEGQLVPIDSEHSAIWQCLLGEPDLELEKVVLTASGGAFRDRSPDTLTNVTPTEALRHPTWNMGRKNTVDSATLMNKGLEVVEATYLFDLPLDAIEIVQHAESIVHSLVYFSDSSVKAQLGVPDMRLPIQYALSFPDRWTNDLQRLDLQHLSSLNFSPIDFDRYPCLRLALEAARAGGTSLACLCAADEVAVELFLDGKIRFTDIPALIGEVLDKHQSCPNPGLDDILQTDATARTICEELSKSFTT